MKQLLLPVFLFIAALLPAQQATFRQVHDNDNIYVPVFASTFAEFFVDPAGWESITISAEELRNAPGYDFSKLEKLEDVQVQFTMDPEGSDSAKKAFTDSIAVWMKNMKQFAKCPKLKRVIFQIGERIYLDHTQCAMDKKEAKNYERYYKRCSVQNLEAAWQSFGKNVQAALPGVELYAYTWGW